MECSTAWKLSVPHKGYPFDLGSLEGRVLRCGFHYAKFDVTTGKVLSPPLGASSLIRPLKTYTVKVIGSDVFVEPPRSE